MGKPHATCPHCGRKSERAGPNPQVRCAQCGQEFTAPPLVCRYCGKELSLAERFYKSRRGHYLCKACYENKKEDKPQEHGARNTLGVMVLAVIIFLCALYVIMREMTRQ